MACELFVIEMQNDRVQVPATARVAGGRTGLTLARKIPSLRVRGLGFGENSFTIEVDRFAADSLVLECWAQGGPDGILPGDLSGQPAWRWAQNGREREGLSG